MYSISYSVLVLILITLSIYTIFDSYLPTIASTTATTKKIQVLKDDNNMSNNSISGDNSIAIDSTSSNNTGSNNSEINMWTASDLPLPSDGSLQICHICRESWTYATGHTLARDTVIIEKL